MNREPSALPDAGDDTVSIAFALAPIPGETASGDLCVVRQTATGVLVAAVDGAGHGVEAAQAAQAAGAVVSKYAMRESPIALVERCHEALRSTRGAVMSLALVDTLQHTLTWLGVGNVEAALFRAADLMGPSERLLVRSGLVGYQLPWLKAEVVSIAPNDTLVMATDGVHEYFPEGLAPRGTPQQIADDVLGRFHKGTDDALVVVARYLGRPRP